MHPDHIGLAGLVYRRANREAPADGVRFHRRAGGSEAAIEGYRSRFGSFGSAHP